MENVRTFNLKYNFIIFVLYFFSFNGFAQLSVNINSQVICRGNSATIGATATGGIAPYTYSWNTGKTNSSIIISPSITTTYNVTVNDANFETASAQATVTVNPKPNVIVNSPSICRSQCATIHASGGTIYSWSTGQTTDSIVVCPSLTTTYIVTGTDINGCVNTAKATVQMNAFPYLSAGGDLICIGEIGHVNVSGADTYTWSNSSTGSYITV
ncbi:MAG: SprB repeat-containing protein, partial [Bacteroidales bacterium]|nr:SprB repeat-containing protein [Bacteroidales bacterium]